MHMHLHCTFEVPHLFIRNLADGSPFLQVNLNLKWHFIIVHVFYSHRPKLSTLKPQLSRIFLLYGLASLVPLSITIYNHIFDYSDSWLSWLLSAVPRGVGGPGWTSHVWLHHVKSRTIFIGSFFLALWWNSTQFNNLKIIELF